MKYNNLKMGLFLTTLISLGVTSSINLVKSNEDLEKKTVVVESDTYFDVSSQLVEAKKITIDDYANEEINLADGYWDSVEEYFKVVKGEKYELPTNSSSSYAKIGEENSVVSDNSMITYEIYQKYIFNMDKAVNNTGYSDICYAPINYISNDNNETTTIVAEYIPAIYLSADNAVNQENNVVNVDDYVFSKSMIGDAYQIIDGRVVKIDSNTSLNGIQCDKLAFSIISVDENNNEHVLGYINGMNIRLRYKEIDAMKEYRASDELKYSK